MKKIKYAIFDMDGTLLDTMSYWRNCVAMYARKIGCELNELYDPDEYIMLPTNKIISRLKAEYPDSPISNVTLDDLFEIMEERYAKSSPLKKGVKELLEFLRQSGTKMCIATATRRKQVEVAMKKSGIGDYFDFILTPNDYPRGKGTADIFFGAAERFGCDVTEMTLFEDSLYSVKTAKELGIYCIGVADYTASNEREELERLCDEFYNEFSEMKLN